MINKFYDLATMQPAVPANRGGPFGVKIAGRMSKASAVFGK